MYGEREEKKEDRRGATSSGAYFASEDVRF
jgi:hypothetical protein